MSPPFAPVSYLACFRCRMNRVCVGPGGSDCLVDEAICHGFWSRIMTLRIVSRLRMVATTATIFGFPLATRRSWKALRTGMCRFAQTGSRVGRKRACGGRASGYGIGVLASAGAAAGNGGGRPCRNACLMAGADGPCADQTARVRSPSVGCGHHPAKFGPARGRRQPNYYLLQNKRPRATLRSPDCRFPRRRICRRGVWHARKHGNQTGGRSLLSRWSKLALQAAIPCLRRPACGTCGGTVFHPRRSR